MPSRKDSPNRSETFGRLLSGAINSIATYEGRTAPVVEEDLGQQLSLSGKTIQRYKAGHLPPEHETVKVLAEAAIQRGYLGREWLQRFLHAACYPFADKLLDQLKPVGPARSRPPRIYENLPAPTYNQFVMREQAFAEVIDGLQQRSAVVLIVGLGGNGKTSLAREVAARCLQDNDNVPHFDAVVWVSDKDRPGTTNLSVVLDEIARTLDYPGFTQFEHEEKLREVEQLLRRQRVLIVIDNFETITDGALLTWLLRLPEPSKALIASREYGREYRRGGWPVELRGMSETEAREFVDQRLRVLRIERLVSDRTLLEPLLVATGGNPKAIEVALGLVKYERRSLQQVVDDLYAARGGLFDDLFTRAWALLDEAARRVLLVMTFFPASASGAALAATADVHGFAFDRAMERLTDLAMLDTQQEDLNVPPRYTLHSLTRGFAKAKLTEQPELELAARKQWVRWYAQLAAQVDFCWNDLTRLKILDPEQETIEAVVNWAFQNQHYAETIQITKDVRYYCDVRGLWDKLQIFDRLGADAARHLASIADEVVAVASAVELLCRQDKIEEAEQQLRRLRELERATELSGAALVFFYQAFFLYWRSCQDLDAAQQICEEMLSRAGQIPLYAQIAGCHWLGTCLYQKGRLAEARELFQKALSDAMKHQYQRSIVFNRHRLAEIDLTLEDMESAEEHLKAGYAKAQEYQDRRYTAFIQRLYARFHILRGDLPAARAALTEAIDLFERLGMRRELTEARKSLAESEAREQAAAAE